MSQVPAVLTAIAVLLGLAGLGGATWAVVKSSAQDATIKRLRGENDDYLKRLNYLEPKVETLERENKTLRDLNNPAEAISDLAAQEARNHAETLSVLRDIDQNLGGRR